MTEKKALRKEARQIAKAILASPDFQRLAEDRAEYERLEKAAAEARQSDRYRAYVYDLKKATGSQAAQAELDRTRADDPQFRLYLSDLAKSQPTTPDGRRAQELLDQMEREDAERRRGERGPR